MRAKLNSSSFEVTVFAQDAENFAKRWLCSGIRPWATRFSFSVENGDLIDSNDGAKQPHADGAALCALADDARLYGAHKLKLALLSWHPALKGKPAP